MLLVVILLDSTGLKFCLGIKLLCNIASLSNHVVYFQAYVV